MVLAVLGHEGNEGQRHLAAITLHLATVLGQNSKFYVVT